MGGNPNAEESSTGAGSGLGSLIDMSGGQSSLSSSTGFGGLSGSGNTLGGTSASAMAGFGSNSPSSGMASRRNRVANSSGSYKGSVSLAGAAVLLAMLML